VWLGSVKVILSIIVHLFVVRITPWNTHLSREGLPVLAFFETSFFETGWGLSSRAIALADVVVYLSHCDWPPCTCVYLWTIQLLSNFLKCAMKYFSWQWYLWVSMTHSWEGLVINLWCCAPRWLANDSDVCYDTFMCKMTRSCATWWI